MIESMSVTRGNRDDFWQSGGWLVSHGGFFGFVNGSNGLLLLAAGLDNLPTGMGAYLCGLGVGGLCSASVYVFCLRAVPRSRRQRRGGPKIIWDRARWLRGRDIPWRYRLPGWALFVSSASLLAATAVAAAG